MFSALAPTVLKWVMTARLRVITVAYRCSVILTFQATQPSRHRAVPVMPVVVISLLPLVVAFAFSFRIVVGFKALVFRPEVC